MAHRRDPGQLAKFLIYILGRRPDEFGVVPDENGFVKIRELLQVLGEENGWKHVRRRDIEEIFWALRDPPLEMSGDALRAASRLGRPRPLPAENPPKLLYGCIRRRAHPVALEKGVFPMGSAWVVLSSSRELAERMGRRRDPRPVMLTVFVRKMRDAGIALYRLGETLFLAATVPVGCFGGPPLEEQKPKPLGKAAPEPVVYQPAGAFLLDPAEPVSIPKSLRGKHAKRDPAWKKERRLLRKKKEKSWPG